MIILSETQMKTGHVFLLKINDCPTYQTKLLHWFHIYLLLFFKLAKITTGTVV